MKRTLSVVVVLGIVSTVGSLQAEAFCWSNLNPAYWGHCPKCEKQKADCKKKTDKDCPCTTGAAAPCSPCIKKECDPCKKTIPQAQPCDACDRLQQDMQK